MESAVSLVWQRKVLPPTQDLLSFLNSITNNDEATDGAEAN